MYDVCYPVQHGTANSTAFLTSVGNLSLEEKLPVSFGQDEILRCKLSARPCLTGLTLKKGCDRCLLNPPFNIWVNVAR
jgi:hypothetical protein